MRFLGSIVEWLDVVVLGLIAVVTAAAALRWLRRSWAGEKLRGR